jgi:NAD+ kinase
MSYKKIGVIADFKSRQSEEAYKSLISKYNLIDCNSLDLYDLDAIIVLGGDGLMLKVLHRYIEQNIPIYGMNRGSIGFLMNEYFEENLIERLNNAITIELHPLKMIATAIDGSVTHWLAINEVSLLRQTNQAAKIRILIDTITRIDCLVCDGILVATPAGSTAYNFAANGPIIPLGSNLLPMTPISPFRPRKWKGALLSNTNKIVFEVLEGEKRPVSAVADFHEVRYVQKVEIQECKDKTLKLLFDPNNNIRERIIKEQFLSE